MSQLPTSAPESRRDRRRASRARTHRLLTALIAAGVGISSSVIGASGAWAAGEALEVNLTSTDGTATFDANDDAGNDSSDSNGIVRVNDTITYKVEVSANSGDSHNTKFVVNLPAGVELKAVPAYCTGPGSSLTPTTTTAPAVPLTSTSYLSLTPQVLTCDLGTRTSGSTFTYPLTVKVRSEIPNGTDLGPVTASATSDEVTTPVVSNGITTKVSAALKWDLSKNGVATQENSGSGVTGPGAGACPWDSSIVCMGVRYPITMSAPAGGKGAAPATSPITFTDDLSPAAFYQLTGTKLAQATADLGKYGARLGGCEQASGGYEVPGYKVGGVNTTTNSVRDSGTITCTQSGGAGTPVSVSIANTDTSLFTYPTTTQNSNGGTAQAIPSNAAYAISLRVLVYYPVAAVTDLGVASGSTLSLVTKNTFTDLEITGLDGSKETSADQPTSNDYRTVNAAISPPGNFSKFFAGVPGTPNNTLPGIFRPTYGVDEGPPGGNTVRSGNITVAPTQTVLSMLNFNGSDMATRRNMSAIACDAWDNTKLQLQAGNYPGSTIAAAQYIGSNGAAVWTSGYNNTGVGDNWAKSASLVPAMKVQYSTGIGGSGDSSTCSTGTWYDSPDAVPGNDPTLAAQGIYSAVSRVRVWTDLPQPVNNARTEVTVSVAMRVVEDATAGEILPNWASPMFKRDGTASMDAMLADSTLLWGKSTYNPSDHSGNAGDRLIAAPAFSRISKLVKGPADADFSSTPPALTGGQTAQYKLSPSLTSAAASVSVSQAVWVEDCLPNSQQYMSASVTPSVVLVGSVPSDAKISCPNATDTYIRWDLGQRVPNVAIPPIIVDVRVSSIAKDGSYTNSATVWADNDPSTLAQRSSKADIQIVNPAGIKLEKVALTPLTQVNVPGQTTNEINKWSISLANVNGPTSLTNPDVIDILPKQGDANGTSFSGTFEFVKAKIIAGTDVTLQYTSAATINQDPNHASNGATGATTWCDAPAGGTKVSGSGSCPTSAAAVTGIRISSTAAFKPGDVITVEVEEVGIGNLDGDIYANTAYARIQGLVLPVGPVSTPERAVGASIGDTVWWDFNKNGVQDDPATEPGIPNVGVHLTGTDDLGNAVDMLVKTDANGKYSFPGLRAGDYKAVVVKADLPADARPVYDLDNGTIDANSDSGDFTLTAGQARTDVDFGYRAIPTVTTKANVSTGYPGDVLTDEVTITGTHNQAGTLTWQLLGPIAPGAGGTCTGLDYSAAPVAGSGTVAITADGVVTTGPVTSTGEGCYTWTQTLSGPGYDADAVSEAGLAEESTLIELEKPTIVTKANMSVGKPGAELSDDVILSGLDGQAGTVTWQLLGPVKPGADGACAGLDYSAAPVVASGTVDVTDDGTITVGKVTVTEEGCYTWTETLSGEHYSEDVISPPGLKEESTLIAADAPPFGHPEDPEPKEPKEPSDPLAFTGANVGGAIALMIALLAAGGILFVIGRRRRRAQEVEG